MDDKIQVQVRPGVNLVVYAPYHGNVDANLLDVDGNTIAFITADAGDASVGFRASHEPIGIWIGRTCIHLPWLELLKVADFLRLDIPLPVPLGEQVPA